MECHTKRICPRNSHTAVLPASFTSILGCSNLEKLRYEWIWEKTQATGFLNAGRMPMKAHEDILVFYDRLPKYNPVKTDGHRCKIVMADHRRKCDSGEIYRKHDNYRDYISTERYPRSVLRFKTDKQKSCLHATQKPVALLEYLIRTYTDEEDLVLDLRWAAAVLLSPAGTWDGAS